MTRGRPRAFDRDEALRLATRVFWERGYETASIAELTAAMGIRPPSLYAAFGDKRALFEEAVARYQAERLPVIDEALALPTAREAVARLLHVHADLYTDPGRPRGCLIVSAAVNVSDDAVRDLLREGREATRAALADRIAADVRAGLLPEGTEAGALADFYAAVGQGMAALARDGASRRALHGIVDTAMKAWPNGSC